MNEKLDKTRIQHGYNVKKKNIDTIHHDNIL